MEQIYAIWLQGVLGVGSRFASLLCGYFGSFEEIYNASADELMSLPEITEKHIAKLQDKSLEKANKVVADCEVLGIDIVTFYDDKYPKSLRNIEDFPVVLFVKGELPDKNTLMVGVVGSRKPSLYGIKYAEKFSADLGDAGITIVSGMARGIDTASHKGALKVGAKTIAVLGCGVDVVYPPENRNIKELIQQNGAVISEYVPGTPPLPVYFPVRNRIVSGLSDAIIVIEGKVSSGSTITAKLALEQGKEVFCLPGNVDNPLSGAPNQLVREGARLVTSAADVLLDMAVENPEHLADTIYSDTKQAQRRNEKIAKLTEEQRKLVEALDENAPTHIDKICYESGLEIAVANQCLLMLELEGIVRQLPGKQYILSL